MNELEEDIKYILKSVKEGRRVALCCILFNDPMNGICERLYHLSNTMPASHVLGEIELWNTELKSITR